MYQENEMIEDVDRPQTDVQIAPDIDFGIVMKFGGTSVQDAVAMRRVVSIVRQNGGIHPLVVTSACAGITNDLVACGVACADGDQETALTIVERIAARHRSILNDLCSPESPNHCSDDLDLLIDELVRLVRGTSLLGETTPRTIDSILAFGERLSSRLLVTAFREEGMNAGLLDSRTCIRTDGMHGSALPLSREIEQRTGRAVAALLSTYDLVVAQGFIGSTLDGITTTIGRGGSDYSAALYGAALGTSEIQIWTDVDGILTADPRVVPTARPVPEMTFTEARELAGFGAKVIHPDTILPAVGRNIPVVIRNSHAPESPGTRIWPDSHQLAPGFHSLTLRRDLLLVELIANESEDGVSRIEEAIGLLGSNTGRIECGVVAGARATLLMRSEHWTDRLRSQLEAFCQTALHPDVAIVCLAGIGLRQTPALLAGPLGALRDVPVRMVIAGSSDHIVLLGLSESVAEESLTLLHQALFASR